MSVAAVFVVSFLLLFGITIILPTLPQIDLIYNMLQDNLGLPEITYNFLGLSGEILMKGITNGVFGGLFVSTIYGLGHRASDKKVIPPVSVPTPAPSPALELTPTPSKPYVTKRPHKVRRIETNVNLDQDIETIEGIGPIYGSRLRYAGVKFVGDLIRKGSTSRGRRDLAEEISVSHSTILKWVNQADLFRISGIGRQYADLLDAAGVNTVLDLSRRRPKALYRKLSETNVRKNLVRRIPPHRKIEGWIQSAKRLEPLVEY